MKSYFIEQEIPFNPFPFKGGWAKKITRSKEKNFILSYSSPPQFLNQAKSEPSEEKKPLKSRKKIKSPLPFESKYMLAFFALHEDISRKELLLYHSIFLSHLPQIFGNGFDCQNQELYYDNKQISQTCYFKQGDQLAFYIGIMLEALIAIKLFNGFTDIVIPIKSWAISAMQHYTAELKEIEELDHALQAY